MANYLNNDDLQKAIELCYENGKISEKLHMMFWRMCNEIIKGKRFSKYTDDWKEDMVSSAYLKCIKVINKKTYTLDKKTPFSYFTSVINNCFKDVVNSENKQIEIKKRNLTFITKNDNSIYKSTNLEKENIQ